jgi:hypothetical protein
MYVPETELPPWIVLGPSLIKEALATASGFPEKMEDEEKVARPSEIRVRPRRYPEASMFVPETDVRLDWPEISSDAPCKYPEAVRFVPDALVKTSVEIVPLGVRSSVEDTTPKKFKVFVLVAKTKVEEPANTPPSLYCTCPVAPPGVPPPVEVEYLLL